MKKMSLSLLAAGVMAAAGLAHADAIFYPDGTVLELGPTGADNLALTSSDSLSMTADNSMSADNSMASDTSVLGAGPAMTTTTTTTVTPVVDYVYVQPNVNWDRSVALDQIHRNYHLMHRGDARMRHQAAATFDTPARAGEASTMTGGAPNMRSDNGAMIVGSYTIPYSAVSVDGPYYVFSY